ncbi:MAG: hypothetical protein DA407_12635, partial [Bacteroidetes bacterium]
MKAFKYIFSVLLLFIINFSVLGQNTSESDDQSKSKEPSYVSLSLVFISDAVYYGRKDSISAPYLYPSITYYNKSGLYLTGSLSYLTKPDEGRVDLFLGTVGYDFTVDKFRSDISFTKYFFNTDSYNVISEVEADITAMAEYDFDLLNLGLSLTTFFNSDSSSDFFLSSEISHDFVTKKKDFQITPTFGVYFGSQNFYEEYYLNNRFGNGRGNASGTGQDIIGTTATSVVVNESDKFGLMSFEFSVPAWYIADPFI